MFKYCRAYSWPNDSDRKELTLNFYSKAKSKLGNLRVPCDFVICVAYQDERFPFFIIAIDMDYSEVAESQISKNIDRFIDSVGKPQAIENPGWFTGALDKTYVATLASNGIVHLTGCFNGKELTPTSEEKPATPVATAKPVATIHPDNREKINVAAKRYEYEQEKISAANSKFLLIGKRIFLTIILFSIFYWVVS